MLRTARNVAIIMVIAAPVAFLPAGTTTAQVLGRALFILFSVLVVLFAGRFYLEHRAEIFGIGDRDRLLAYASIGAVVLALAGRPTWGHSSIGTAAFVALVAFAVVSLYGVYRRWRAY